MAKKPKEKPDKKAPKGEAPVKAYPSMRAMVRK